MSSNARLVAFVRARLDDNESAARGAKGESSGHWGKDNNPADWIALVDRSGKLTVGHDRHITRQDPARTLRRIAAQRELLAAYAELADLDTPGYDYPHGRAAGLGFAVRQMAREHEDHPDYRPAWGQGFIE